MLFGNGIVIFCKDNVPILYDFGIIIVYAFIRVMDKPADKSEFWRYGAVHIWVGGGSGVLSQVNIEWWGAGVLSKYHIGGMGKGVSKSVSHDIWTAIMVLQLLIFHIFVYDCMERSLISFTNTGNMVKRILLVHCLDHF